jgi:type IV pilus assembly protein PilF
MRPGPPRILLAAVLLAGCATGPSPKAIKAAEIHHDLAVEAVRQDRPQEALREYDEALKSDPDMPEAHYGRGMVMEFGFGRLRDAEVEYRRALEVRPAYSEASNALGQLLAKAGRYEEAIQAFDQALESTFYKEPWVARCNKGLTLYRMGRRDDGLGEIKTCLAIAPRFCFGRREYGRLLLGEGKVKEALSELAVYARDCADVADAHFQLGLAHLKAGDLPAAREELERCEALAKGQPPGDECRKSRQLLE